MKGLLGFARRPDVESGKVYNPASHDVDGLAIYQPKCPGLLMPSFFAISPYE
jgi:hypothetical protein